MAHRVRNHWPFGAHQDFWAQMTAIPILEGSLVMKPVDHHTVLIVPAISSPKDQPRWLVFIGTTLINARGILHAPEKRLVVTMLNVSGPDLRWGGGHGASWPFDHRDIPDLPAPLVTLLDHAMAAIDHAIDEFDARKDTADMIEQIAAILPAQPEIVPIQNEVPA